MLTRWTLAIGLALGAANTVMADPPKEKVRPHDGLIVRLFGPVPTHCVDQLDLTAEQRDKVQAMEQERAQKNKQMIGATAIKVYTMVDACRRGDPNAEPAPGLAIAHDIIGCVLECRRNHVLVERQLQGVLSPDQKVKFAELTERERRPNRRAQRDEEGMIPSRQMVRTLRLDAEQQKKIAQMHEETMEKVRAMLTDEQRKQFDQLARRHGDGERKSLKPKNDREKE